GSCIGVRDGFARTGPPPGGRSAKAAVGRARHTPPEHRHAAPIPARLDGESGVDDFDPQDRGRLGVELRALREKPEAEIVPRLSQLVDEARDLRRGPLLPRYGCERQGDPNARRGGSRCFPQSARHDRTESVWGGAEAATRYSGAG